MLSFYQAVEDDFISVNKLILEQVASDVGLVEEIGNYLIEAGGKRLRPLLVLLIARAVCYKGSEQYTLATIIEFLHTATLLHDDVVDASHLRRGRTTVNTKWGNPPSVLVGDFLYSRAFQLMVAIGNMGIMDILSRAANIICEGEVQQLVNVGDPALTESNYMVVIHRKTAVLFEAACETATILGQVQGRCDDQLRQQLKNYGYHLGMAFQLVDDTLDYIGNSASLGKNTGDDLAEGKPTLPLIIAMERASRPESQLIANLVRNHSGTVNPDTLQQVIAIIQKTGALDYTRQHAVRHANEARGMLADLPDSNHKQALLDLADFSVSRNH